MKKGILVLGLSIIAGSYTFAAPPKQVVVGPESTVYGIAYENGISTRALIAANNLTPPYVLFLGQVLTIPSPGEHIVGAGETLQTIAENYGVNVDVLAQENGIHSPYFVQQGVALSIPSHDTDSLSEGLMQSSPEIVTSSLAPLPLVKVAQPDSPTAKATASAQKNALPEDLAAELAQEKGVSASATKPVLMGNLAKGNAGAPVGGAAPLEEEEVKEKPKKKKEKEVAKKEEKKEKPKEELKEVIFIWPVEGKILSKFSAEGKNDGINIQVPEGTAVKAAAAGEVMYAGNELKGFGNLLLIKHKDGWVTAYAHLSDLLVKKGDSVKQGHLTAKSGKTGDAKEPQLHFEVRKGKLAVDPLGKLES